MIYLFEQYFRSPLFLNNDNNPLHDSEFMIFETKNDHIIIVKILHNGHYIHINDDNFYKATAYNITPPKHKTDDDDFEFNIYYNTLNEYATYKNKILEKMILKWQGFDEKDAFKNYYKLYKIKKYNI